MQTMVECKRIEREMCLNSLLFHTVDFPTGQGLQLVNVERLTIGLIRLAPLHFDNLRRPWCALGVKAEWKVPSSVLFVAHQLFGQIRHKYINTN